MNHRELFKRHLGQTSDFPLMLEIERAQGIMMYGKNHQYMDLIAGIGVSSLGHNDPDVVQAIKTQADKYLHLMVYGEFVQSPQVEFAKALSSTLPQHLDNCYLVNSGSEAAEGAIKLAKRYTGRKELISCHNAYHGSTNGALSVSGGEHLKANFRPLLPCVTHISYNQIEELAMISDQTAAVIIESVQGEAGVHVPDKEYMHALRQRCDETGTLLILDEIQCGAGRTGKFWAFEHFGITPDILLTAKGIAGGMPIGAFISSKEIMGVLKNDPILGHITTFGGHPVSSAAGKVTVEKLRNTNLIDQVEGKANLIKSLLVHDRILEIRNCGLLMAVQFDSFNTNKTIIDKAIEKGLLTDWFLFCDDALRIAPPLIITEEEIKKACKTLLEVIDSI